MMVPRADRMTTLSERAWRWVRSQSGLVQVCLWLLLFWLLIPVLIWKSRLSSQQKIRLSAAFAVAIVVAGVASASQSEFEAPHGGTGLWVPIRLFNQATREPLRQLLLHASAPPRPPRSRRPLRPSQRLPPPPARAPRRLPPRTWPTLSRSSTGTRSMSPTSVRS